MENDLDELKERLRMMRNAAATEAAKALEQLQAEVARLNDVIAKQARSARAGMDAAKAHAGLMLAAAEKAQAESSPDAIASERAANAALTEEVEQLQAENAKLKGELEEARKALAYAIEEADGWCDESRGCDVRGPEMGAAREIAARQKKG